MLAVEVSPEWNFDADPADAKTLIAVSLDPIVPPCGRGCFRPLTFRATIGGRRNTIGTHLAALLPAHCASGYVRRCPPHTRPDAQYINARPTALHRRPIRPFYT